MEGMTCETCRDHSTDYDLVVVGAGLAAFAAAIRATEVGYRVGLLGASVLGEGPAR